MIIDVHGHWGPWFFTMEVADLSANLAVMDRYGIDLAIVSGTEAICYDAPAGNRALAAALEQTDRLYGYVSVNPRSLADAERDLRELLATPRFVGAKLHTDYSGSPIASPQTHDALAMLADLDCPVLVHTWGTTVLDLAQACADLPRLRAIAGHAAADGWRHAVEAARSCDRLYLEPSWSHAPAGRFAGIVSGVDDRQLLFGTDATLIDPASAMGAVLGAGVTGETAQRLAWRNATDLFGLPDHDAGNRPHRGYNT
ncbi:amidohydrolase family protein [Allorhizocola rhizosphaerae]|uniref:amidohydrolase family protein n=1 Tax=Allorhizocola rhizosphaerae TaxID=1872709 RepID=UPI000E3CA2C1|nr:amidohydrolase family protein [Allorhizocola rhizosphaerae]